MKICEDNKLNEQQHTLAKIWQIQNCFYNMQSIANENNLLKTYIATLEKENEARNTERSMLCNEIDRMSLEISRLEGLLSKSPSTLSPTSTASKQITKLKKANLQFINELQAHKKENTRLTSELQARQIQIMRIEMERQQLSCEIDDKTKLSTLSNSKLSSLESQITNLKHKIVVYEQNNQQYIIQISALQGQNTVLQSKINGISAELEKEKDKIIILQFQNEQLRSTQRSTAQISSLQGIKANLEATIKRLNSKLEWHQSNSKAFQQERLEWGIKMQQMQNQLNRVNQNFAECRAQGEVNAHLAASRALKEKELQALEQTIGSLKDNKKYLEKSLKEKSEIISSLESQVYQLTNSHSIQQSLESQINTLLESKAEADKQYVIVVKKNQEISFEIEILKQKEEGYLAELNSCRRERETLLREIDQYRTSLEEARSQLKTYRSKSGDYTFNMKEVSPRYRGEKDVRWQSNNDLRLMVLGLQQQVTNLKASQANRPSSIMENSQVESYLNLNSKAQLMMQSRSPPSRIAVRNQRQKVTYNKNKWESLQWKINLLRNQNQTLKKTLFD